MVSAKRWKAARVGVEAVAVGVEPPCAGDDPRARGQGRRRRGGEEESDGEGGFHGETRGGSQKRRGKRETKRMLAIPTLTL